MSSQQSQFEILIKTTADASGAQKTTAELAKLKQSVDLSAQSHDQAAAHVDKHTLSHKQLHKIIHGLNQTVPGLGVAFQAMVSPVTAAIVIAMSALEYFKEKIAETNAELDKMSEEAAKPASHRLEAMREATVSSALALNSLNEKLEDAARGERTLAQNMAEAIEKSKEQSNHANTLSDALKSKELASLDLVHSAGLLSTIEYEEAKFAIEEAAAKRKRDLQEREMMNEFLMKRRALGLAQGDQPGLNDKATEAGKKYEEAAIHAATIKMNNKGDEANREKAKKDLEEFEKSIGKNASVFNQIGKKVANPEEFLKTYTDNMERHPMMGDEYGENVEQYKTWAQKRNAFDTLDNAYKKGPAWEAAAEVVKDRARAEMERANERAVGNEKFTTDLSRDVGQSRDAYDTTVAHNRETGATETATRRALLDAQEIAQYRALKGKAVLSPEDSDQIQQLVQLNGQLKSDLTRSVVELQRSVGILNSARINGMNP